MPTISSGGPARPEVIIVGAGLGGLLLGQLLEQIDVPYHIFERAESVKPLGTLAVRPSRLSTSSSKRGARNDSLHRQSSY